MKLKGKLEIRSKETAVIVIDLQNGCCSPDSLLARITKQDTSPIEAMIKKLPGVLDDLREVGIEVIWVRTDYSKESVLENVREAETTVFGEFFDTCQKGTWGFDYYGPRPRQHERKFVKLHPSAFQNQELENYLEEKQFKTLLFVGVYTSRCVFCSLAGASERGYRCILISDMAANWAEKEYETKAVQSIIHGMLGFTLDSLQTLKAIQQ